MAICKFLNLRMGLEVQKGFMDQGKQKPRFLLDDLLNSLTSTFQYYDIVKYLTSLRSKTLKKDKNTS